jgi:thioesterase domain-containing protein
LVHCYVELARALGRDQPLYGIQSPAGHGAMPGSIEEMAARYIADIRQVEPRGPYNLAGWSMGALIAFEMAQQLSAAGDAIGLAAMLDGYPARTPVTADPAGRDQRVGAWVLDYLLRHGAESLGLPAESLERAASVEARAAVYLAAAQAQQRIPADIGVDQFLQFLSVQATNEEAAYAYRPRRYEGALTVFRSAQAGPNPWTDLCRTMTVFDLPARHSEFVRGANAWTIARLLQDCLSPAAAAATV